MQNLLTIRDRRGERVVDKSDRSLADLLPAAQPVQETPAAAEANDPAVQPPAPRSARLGVSSGQIRAGLQIVAGLAVAGLLIALLGTWSPAVPRQTSAAVPTVPAASPPTTAAPVPTAVPAPPLAAFWAPGGERAPDITAGTVFTPTARYGGTWVAITLPGGGSVWIGRSDAERRGSLPAALPDLAPPTPAPAPPPAPARPASAPQVPAAVPAAVPANDIGEPCRLPDAPAHVVSREIRIDDIPRGRVVGLGCTQAEAETNAAAEEAAWRASHE